MQKEHLYLYEPSLFLRSVSKRSSIEDLQTKFLGMGQKCGNLLKQMKHATLQIQFINGNCVNVEVCVHGGDTLQKALTC